jgi:hypothetical protein
MKVKTPRDALRHYADEQERQSQREERPSDWQRPSIGDHPESREQQADPRQQGGTWCRNVRFFGLRSSPDTFMMDHG